MYDDVNLLPFQNISNNEFELLNSKSTMSQNDMDRLSQLKFNPFESNQQINHNIALSDNNVDLDSSFNTNMIQCTRLLLTRGFQKTSRI